MRERYQSGTLPYAEPGMSVADIARGMGLSRRAVQRTLRQAEAKLRVLLLQEMEP